MTFFVIVIGIHHYYMRPLRCLIKLWCAYTFSMVDKLFCPVNATSCLLCST